MDWFNAVDEYLYSVARMGLEQLLCRACLSGAVPSPLAQYAAIERELAGHMTEADGGTHESYSGVLTVAGVRYQFLCDIFIDSDGSHFVSHIAHFEPRDWAARMAIA